MLWRARARFHLTCSFDRSSFFLLASPFAGNGIGYATAPVLCEPKWAESFLRSKTSAVALRVAANAKATFDLEAVALCRDRLVFLSSSKRSSFLGCLEIGECGCHCIRAPVCALQAQRLSTFWVPSSSWSCFGCFILSHEQKFEIIILPSSSSAVLTWRTIHTRLNADFQTFKFVHFKSFMKRWSKTASCGILVSDRPF